MGFHLTAAHVSPHHFMCQVSLDQCVYPVLLTYKQTHCGWKKETTHIWACSCDNVGLCIIIFPCILFQLLPKF